MKVYLEGKQITEDGRIDFSPKGNVRSLLTIGEKQLLVWAYIGLDNDGQKCIRCYQKRRAKRAAELPYSDEIKCVHARAAKWCPECHPAPVTQAVRPHP